MSAFDQSKNQATFGTLDKWLGSYEANGVTEFRSLANQFQLPVDGAARLRWRGMTLAARWRG